MKRSLSFLLMVCVVAALTGWVAAQARNLYREREAGEKAEQARLAAEADAKKLAGKIADLARQADEVVLSWFGGAQGKEKREIRLSDAAWQARFASLLANATFKPSAHLLAVSSPMIGFYRNKVEVLFLDPGVGTVIVHDERVPAEFRLSHPAGDAIMTLVHEKDPDVSAASGPTAVKPAAAAPVAAPSGASRR